MSSISFTPVTTKEIIVSIFFLFFYICNRGFILLILFLFFFKAVTIFFILKLSGVLIFLLALYRYEWYTCIAGSWRLFIDDGKVDRWVDCREAVGSGKTKERKQKKRKKREKYSWLHHTQLTCKLVSVVNEQEEMQKTLPGGHFNSFFPCRHCDQRFVHFSVHFGQIIAGSFSPDQLVGGTWAFMGWGFRDVQERTALTNWKKCRRKLECPSLVCLLDTDRQEKPMHRYF